VNFATMESFGDLAEMMDHEYSKSHAIFSVLLTSASKKNTKI